MEVPRDGSNTPVWFTVDEAADYLRLSTSTLKKKVALNVIPHRHVGRRVILNRAELDAWVNSKPGVRCDTSSS